MEVENSKSLEKMVGELILTIEWSGVGFLRLAELMLTGEHKMKSGQQQNS